MPTLDSLLKIDKTLVKQASINCARAFEDDSLTHWMIPNPAKRPNLRYVFEMHLRMALANKGLDAYTTSPACEGVIAFTLTEPKFSLWEYLKAGYPFSLLRCGWRYFWLDKQTTFMGNKLRKQYALPKHCYLAALGVAPAHQQQGIASTLIKSLLTTLAQDKMPCYLETQNMTYVGMYQHFGFKLVYQTCVHGGNHPLYLMLHQP